MSKPKRVDSVTCGTCFKFSVTGPDAAALLKAHYEDKHPQHPLLKGTP